MVNMTISRKYILIGVAVILLCFGVLTYFMFGHGEGVKNPKNIPGLTH